MVLIASFPAPSIYDLPELAGAKADDGFHIFTGKPIRMSDLLLFLVIAACFVTFIYATRKTN
jgi:hypothetical protein